MSIVNPYITTDTNDLDKLKNMFRLFVTKESKKRTDLLEITFKGDDRYKINGETFKLEWNLMKKLANDPTHLFLLEYFEKFRKIFVDSLIYIVIKSLKDCDNNEKRFNKCTAVALGSASITSDYDINLLSDNPTINADIIRKFNKLFEKNFKNNSSAVFDTNIYGIGFLNREKYIIPIEKRIQSEIAFVKLIYIERKFKMDVRREFNINFIFFDTMYENATDFYIDKLYNIGDNGDKLYIETLESIQTILGKENDLSILEYLPFDKQEQIQSLISLANMYANETYFTQGAFLHVVSRLQSGENIELSETDYINSMLENFFEILKEYAIFKHSTDVNLFLKSSYKYLFRFYDAAKEAGLDINQDLYEIFQDLEILRKGNQDDIMNQRKLIKAQNKLIKFLGKIDNDMFPVNGITGTTDNLKIKEYMSSFWGIFLYLFKQSLLIIPSPGTSRRSSIKQVKRRASSYTPVNPSIMGLDRLSLENMDKKSKKLRTEKRKLEKGEKKIKILKGLNAYEGLEGLEGLKGLFKSVKNREKTGELLEVKEPSFSYTEQDPHWTVDPTDLNEIRRRLAEADSKKKDTSLLSRKNRVEESKSNRSSGFDFSGFKF
jgi:hypothetical protein